MYSRIAVPVDLAHTEALGKAIGAASDLTRLDAVGRAVTPHAGIPGLVVC
jgi:hypothetical protein